MTIPYFDAHCDTISQVGGAPFRANDRHLDLTRLHAFSRAGQLFAVFADASSMRSEALFPECERQVRRFMTEVDKNGDIACRCRTRAEVERAFAQHRVAALLSIEGAELLNCDPEKLETAQAWGVRAINLTWNNPNALSGTNAREADRGLSALGRAFVREAERRDIRMDVSHLSEKGFWDLMEISTKPVIASHSNAKALCPHTRNLTDEQFRAIVRSGGFVGINAYTAFLGKDATIEGMIRHIEHFWALGGENTVGLGSDWDGCDSLAAGITGVQDMTKLYEALYRRNTGEALLNRLFCDNLLAVL